MNNLSRIASGRNGWHERKDVRGPLPLPCLDYCLLSITF